MQPQDCYMWEMLYFDKEKGRSWLHSKFKKAVRVHRKHDALDERQTINRYCEWYQ